MFVRHTRDCFRLTTAGCYELRSPVILARRSCRRFRRSGAAWPDACRRRAFRSTERSSRSRVRTANFRQDRSRPESGPKFSTSSTQMACASPSSSQPINTGHALDAAAEQSSRAVADGREINGVVRHKRAPVDLAGHAALADDHIAVRDLEPAIQIFGETEGGRRGHRSDRHAAVGSRSRRPASSENLHARARRERPACRTRPRPHACRHLRAR